MLRELPLPFQDFEAKDVSVQTQRPREFCTDPATNRMLKLYCIAPVTPAELHLVFLVKFGNKLPLKTVISENCLGQITH